MMTSTLQSLPDTFVDNAYSYLWYDYLKNNFSFVNFELGVGLLNNVSDKPD